jgi:hypothetical protein
MEKGRILQAWSETEPSHFAEAVTHWTELRTLLSNVKGKKPPQYYEVVYNAAECLYKDADKTKDAKKADIAKQLLGKTLFLNSNLDGPDSVARYQALLKQIEKLLPPEKPAAAASAKK